MSQIGGKPIVSNATKTPIITLHRPKRKMRQNKWLK